MRRVRGEFIRGDGLVLPNNISIAGSEAILLAWARGVVPVFVFGLVKGSPTPTMVQGDMVEPTIGTNGYARHPITRDVNGWPVFGNVGVENYVGTPGMVFTPVGGPFNQEVNRLALFDTVNQVPSNPVYALSVPLPSPVVLTTTTPVEERTFYYRLYL